MITQVQRKFDLKQGSLLVARYFLRSPEQRKSEFSNELRTYVTLLRKINKTYDSAEKINDYYFSTLPMLQQVLC